MNLSLLRTNKFIELLTLYISDIYKKEFWDELNEILKTHNEYYKNLSIENKIALASNSFIANIQDITYKNINQLRKGTTLFPIESKLNLNDIELLFFILRRCNMIYDFPQSKNLLLENSVNKTTDENITNIIFMFLGGLPNGDDEHYSKFFKTTNETFYIVVHPIKLDGYIENNINTNEFYKKMYDSGRLLIVDNEHHLRTKWATFSLVSAVLLMIQYSLKQKGSIFKKFVLLSSNDKPLYNYNVLHETLNIDDKSWLYYSDDNGGYARYFLKKPYSYQGGIFSTDDVVYVSQWMALDIKHIVYFIDFKNKNFITYKKNGEIKCGNDIIDGISAVKPNSIYDKYLLSFVGSYNSEFTYDELKQVIENGYCIGTDEYFFGVVLKHYFKSTEEFKNNIRFEYIHNLEKYNTKQYINNVDDEDFYLTKFKTVYESKLSSNIYTNNFRTWYGGSPKFGKYKFRIQIIKNKNPSSDKSDEFFIVNDNKILKISKEKLDRLTTEGFEYYKTLIGGGSNQNDYGVNEYIEFNDNTFTYTYDLNDLYSISSTYTDWSMVNVNPSNMFRDFNIYYFKLSNNVIDKPIIQIINNIEPFKIITDIIKKSSRTNDNINDEFVKGPSYHPIEYLTYSFLSIINSYNFIVFLDLDDETKTSYFNNDYKNAKNIYFNIIDNNKEYIDFVEHDGKTYYYFKDIVNNEIKQIMYGHPITSFSLNNALAYGALFIRKVMNDSLIEKYTEQLMNLNMYIPNNYSSYPERNNKYINYNTVIFNELADNNTLKNKYLKYKKKYLLIKNKSS